MTSIDEVAPGKSTLTQTLAGSMAKLGRTYQAELGGYHKALTGENEVPEILLTEEEKQLESIVPEIIAGPTEFLEKRRSIGSVDGLHGFMAFEVVNFIDGERTITEIRDAVSAEFGPVPTEDIARYVDDLVRVGVAEWR